MKNHQIEVTDNFIKYLEDRNIIVNLKEEQRKRYCCCLRTISKQTKITF